MSKGREKWKFIHALRSWGGGKQRGDSMDQQNVILGQDCEKCWYLAEDF